MAYRNFRTAFWTDPEVKKLKPQLKLLFAYLICNPHSHYCGLYYIPEILIANETGLTIKTVQYGIDMLSRSNLIKYDKALAVVWVITMLKDCPYNEKQRIGIPRHLKTLHNCSLIKEFLEYYQELDISYQYPINRLPIGDPPVSVLVSETVSGTEDKQSVSDKTDEVRLFLYWNSKPNLIKHREKSFPKYKPPIQTALKIATQEEIQVAIDNYDTVLTNPQTYFFSYRWTLNDFLTRGLERFLAENKPLERLKSREAQKKPTPRTGGREDTNYPKIMRERQKSKQEQT